MEAEEWTLESLMEMLKSFENKTICPVTYESIPTSQIAESIRGTNWGPWKKLKGKLKWVQDALESGLEGVGYSSGGSGGRGLLGLGGDDEENDDDRRGDGYQRFVRADSSDEKCDHPDRLTERPWVFIACG
jgi:hypothetical protein